MRFPLRRDDQEPLGAGEGDKILAGQIKSCGEVVRLSRGPFQVHAELGLQLVRAQIGGVETSHEHHRPLPALSLVDGGQHHMPGRM